MINLLKRKIFQSKSGYNISQDVVKNYMKDPDFPFFVSFPRTGSHWLRMLMELYFEQPSLSYVFFAKKPISFTCYHRHDIQLNHKYRKQLLYLYRNPTDTIYSQIKYLKLNNANQIHVKSQTLLYKLNFEKWVVEENFATKKILINYDILKNSPHKEFEKLCSFFNVPYNKVKFQEIYNRVTKQKISKKTQHDTCIINLSDNYDVERIKFKKKYGQFINSLFFEGMQDQKKIFKLENS